METNCKLCGRIGDDVREAGADGVGCERCGRSADADGDDCFVPPPPRLPTFVAAAVEAHVELEEGAVREDRRRDLEVLAGRSRQSMLPPPPSGFDPEDHVVDAPESVRRIVRLALADSLLPTAPPTQRPRPAPAIAQAPSWPRAGLLGGPVGAARRRRIAASAAALVLGIAGGLVGFVGVGVHRAPESSAEIGPRTEALLEEDRASSAAPEPAEIAAADPPAPTVGAPRTSMAEAAIEPERGEDRAPGPTKAAAPPVVAPRPLASAVVSALVSPRVSAEASIEPKLPRVATTPTAAPATSAPAETRASAPPPDAGSAPNLLDAINDAVAKADPAAPAKAPNADDVALQPFDRGGAQAALQGIAASVAQCRGEGVEGGRGGVSVTFAPSGATSAVRLDDGPLSGTATGQCIARLFNTAKVRPFSGAAITVHRSFLLN